MFSRPIDYNRNGMHPDDTAVHIFFVPILSDAIKNTTDGIPKRFAAYDTVYESVMYPTRKEPFSPEIKVRPRRL